MQLPIADAQRTALRRHRRFVPPVLLACGLAFGCASAPDDQPHEGATATASAVAHEVASESLGVRLALENFLVFREAEGAPAGLGPLLARKRHVDDSPLFVAVSRRDPNLGLTYLIQPQAGDLDGTFGHMIAGLSEDTELHEAKRLPNGRAIRTAYTIQQGVLRVRANALVFLHQGNAHTLMASSAVGADPFDALAEAARQLELRTDTGWQRPFAPFPRDLETENLPGLEIASDRESPNPLDGVECEPGERPLFFRARGERGIVHLFGSIHFGHESFFPFAAPVEDAFGSSTRLGVEFDMRTGNSQEAQQAFASAARLDGHPDLRSALTEETYEQLVATTAELGLPIEAFDQLDPWAVALTLSALVWQTQGFDPAQGVDLYFLNRAADREIVELESLGEQLELFSTLDGESFLEMTLDSLGYIEQDTRDVYRAWRCGDAELMTWLFVDLPIERGHDIGDFVEQFLDQRNERMADDVMALLEKEGESFVVIGAAHLVGPAGLPALLRARGISVEAR